MIWGITFSPLDPNHTYFKKCLNFKTFYLSIYFMVWEFNSESTCVNMYSTTELHWAISPAEFLKFCHIRIIHMGYNVMCAVCNGQIRIRTYLSPQAQLEYWKCLINCCWVCSCSDRVGAPIIVPDITALPERILDLCVQELALLRWPYLHLEAGDGWDWFPPLTC